MTRAVDAVRGLVSAPIGWLTTGSDHRGRFPLVERTIAVHSTRGCVRTERRLQQRLRAAMTRPAQLPSTSQVSEET